MTFIGLTLVTGALSGSGGVSLKAVMLGLGSGLEYALYSIFGKFLADKYSSEAITTFTFIVAAVFIVPLSGILGHIDMLISVSGILSALGLSLLSMVIPFMAYTKGLRAMEAGKASALSYLPNPH